MSQATERAAVLRRLLRAGAIAVAVIIVTVLAFAPSAEGHAARSVEPDPGWPVVSLVGLALLAVIVPAAVVIAVRRRRY